jgi:hypothetical protein
MKPSSASAGDTSSSMEGVIHTVESPEVRTVKKRCKFFLADFEDLKEKIEGKEGTKSKVGWLVEFSPIENHVKEYLEKLQAQMGFAIKILKQSDPWTHEQCVKIIELWNCAQRRDVKEYFKKLADKKAKEQKQPSTDLKTEEPNITTSYSYNEVKYEDQPPDFQGDKEISVMINRDLTTASFQLRAVTIQNKDKKFEETKYDAPVLYEGNAKNKFSEICKATKMSVPGIGLFRLEIIGTAKGFLQDAIYKILEPLDIRGIQVVMTVKFVTLICNHFEGAEFLCNAREFERESGCKEKQVFYGCRDERESMEIAEYGFRREHTGEHTHGIGVHFHKDPKEPTRRAEKESKKGGMITLIIAKLLVSHEYKLKPGQVAQQPIARGSSNNTGVNCTLYYDSHVAGDVITANRDHQAYPLFIIQGMLEPVKNPVQQPPSLSVPAFS